MAWPLVRSSTQVRNAGKYLFFLEWDDQALDDTVVLDVFGENLFHIFLGLGGVPDVVWVDHYRWPLSAGIEASRLVDPYFAFEAAVVDASFQVIQKVG